MEKRVLPWAQRLHDAHPVPPWLVGTSIFLGLTLAFTVVELALGRQHLVLDLAPGSPALRNVRLAIVLFLGVGVAVAASLFLVQRERESLRALVPHLRLSADEAEALFEAPGRFRRGALWRGSLIGIVLALLIPLLSDPARILYDPRLWDPEMVWHRVVVLALGWWLGRLVALVVTQSLRTRDLVERLPELDLFDPAPLRLFTSQVSSHVLVLGAATAVMALTLLEERFGLIFGALVTLNGSLAAVAVLGPLRGIRDRLRAAKARALTWCRGELAIAVDRLEDATEGRDAPGRVADLVAYEARVESVAEWPFDGRAIRRLGFYLLIPLLSWSGGAIVERLIDSLLD